LSSRTFGNIPIKSFAEHLDDCNDEQKQWDNSFNPEIILQENDFEQVHHEMSVNLCTPHICKCNAKVDEIGIHGLSCSPKAVGDIQDTLKLILLSTSL
jgi:hypothetical protein